MPPYGRAATQPEADEEYELRPPGDPLYNLDDPSQRAVVEWKLDCFERLGFAPTAATALALRRDIEREKVESLVAKGARLSEVVAILL